jgi:thymidylate synthase (FAD)
MKAEYIDHLGSDLTVVNAARVSFDKESDWAEGYHTSDKKKGILSYKDSRLISYLARHGHWTPFSHPQITLRYTVPIFVARQEFKHIVGFTRNEVSRRYVDDEPEFYVPEVWRSRPDKSMKQGSGTEPVEVPTLRDHGACVQPHDYAIQAAQRAYTALLEAGVAPEQARMVLPQSMYTSYYVTGSLAAFARFYRQRTDSHAQQEIQELAHQVGSIIEPLFPVSWSALCQES